MSATYSLRAPNGSLIRIPQSYDPGEDPYLALQSPSLLREYYEREGYVVVRGLIPPTLCHELKRAFDERVKPSRAYFYRHESGRPEMHVFTEHGFMRYPIMNVQDLGKRYDRFVDAGLQTLTHDRLKRVVAVILGEPGKLMHSMYFEGNQVTWAHQDSYYIDADRLGGMIGLWIALEDIHPGAGRFYVCPRSHRLAMPRLGSDLQWDPNGQDYKGWVLQQIDDHGLEFRAPALRAGDAMLWSSATIHGSLETTEPTRSRSSLTGHFIPQSAQLVYQHAQKAHLRSEVVNGMLVHFHNDQRLLKNRMSFFLEARWPKVWGLGRRVVALVETRLSRKPPSHPSPAIAGEGAQGSPSPPRGG